MAPKRPSTTTVILYAAVALCLLFVLASLPRLPSGGRLHRRLKLRTDFPPDPARFAVRFDPIVAEIEMRREDRAWERSHYALPPLGAGADDEWEGYGDAEDYINDEGRFDVSRRIEELFPMIDVDPKDGRVTLRELKAWFLKQATSDKEHRTKRGMELYDRNKDGFVSFGEYQEHGDLFPDGNSSEMHSGWFTPEHFRASDMDEDGRLNLSEFSDFFHPADSKNPKLISWLCKEEIRNRDKDKDGKLTFEEFYPGLVEFLSGFNPNISHHSENSIKDPGRELFARLDLDKDGYLNEKELEPVIDTFHPSELLFADGQAEHAFKQADSDKDGHLTLKEMMDHPYAFYMAVETDEEYDPSHEEFR